MITSSHTKSAGFVMSGTEIEHGGERESPRARVIDWAQPDGIDTEGRSLMCLPDKSLSLGPQ